MWILAYCQTIPPPPPKGECLQCASVTLICPAGRWRGDTEGGEGEPEMKFVVPMQFLSLVLGGSTDASVAEPNLCCFLVTTMAERP